ncbi:MAG: site-specific DNA-methyltransferase [Lachnospiraceae bacterium]|nr:site-specific DNA-methyltransferase [Lachnospiraceae bacterium]
MTRIKADRNKTIDFPIDEGTEYLKRCIRVNEDVDVAVIQNQIIVGDTFQILSHLPQGFVDLLIVDPPYNLSKNYHGNSFSKKKETEYREYTKAWLELVLPLLKSTASIYVCCDWKSSIVIGEVLREYSCLRNRITWQREKGRGAKENWKNGMEDIWFSTVSEQYTFNVDAVKIRRKVVAPYRENGTPKDWEETEAGKFRNTCPSNFWDDITIPYWSMAENTAHPTQKPEKLMAKLILASSNPGDIILDPFSGAGTTAVTAKKLGRNFVGIELNELYCAWTQKRLEMAEEDKTIQGYRDGVFWERNTSTLQSKSTDI